MTISVSLLKESSLEAASRLLARAFAEDPIITYFLHDPIRRAIVFPAFFEGVLEELLPSGAVFAARDADDLVGVAAWLPPHVVEPDQSALARAAGCRRLVQSLFPLTSQALYDGFVELEKLHPPEPHWYLAFVGIEPSMQRRGIGRSLIDPVLAAADDTQSVCYLETPFPATHGYYERLGFERGRDYSPFVEAPQGVATFVRKPRS